VNEGEKGGVKSPNCQGGPENWAEGVTTSFRLDKGERKSWKREKPNITGERPYQISRGGKRFSRNMIRFPTGKNGDK